MKNRTLLNKKTDYIKNFHKYNDVFERRHKKSHKNT